MVPSLDELTRLFNHPQSLHSAIVHLPVAVALLGMPMLVLLTTTAGKSALLRGMSVGLYLLGAGVAFWAAQVGDTAYGDLNPLVMNEAAVQTLAHHRRLGDWVWVSLLGVGVIAALTALPKRSLRLIALMLALVGSTAALGHVALTAHHGGELVYRHGAGVPTTEANVNPSDEK